MIILNYDTLTAKRSNLKFAPDNVHFGNTLDLLSWIFTPKVRHMLADLMVVSAGLNLSDNGGRVGLDALGNNDGSSKETFHTQLSKGQGFFSACGDTNFVNHGDAGVW